MDEAAPALVALCANHLGLDDDDIAAATRRGLLLAAAAGDPAANIGSGSAAALETAADLAELGIGTALCAELGRLAEDEGAALEALAVLLLTSDA